MNCINHPEAPVSAFCQNCGKPLCEQCVRPVQGLIFCEPCLMAKLSGAPGYTAPGYTVPGYTAPGYATSAGLPGSPIPNGGFPDGGPKPALAGFLGVIPGVGAMYNGQFIKALVHVLVFVVLVSLSHVNHMLGMFIAAWILYQVFDAYQTAKARRDGMPLPDPFGLNDLGRRMGGHSPGPAPWSPPWSATTTAPGPGPMGGAVPPGVSAFTDVDPGIGQNPGYASQPGAPPYVPYASIPLDPMAPPAAGPAFGPPLGRRRSEPIGAIILIGLGLLFLFSTTGYLDGEWISHGWPLILVAVGVWLVIKRVSEVKK